jgi:hypothetical protein
MGGTTSTPVLAEPLARLMQAEAVEGASDTELAAFENLLASLFRGKRTPELAQNLSASLNEGISTYEVVKYLVEKCVVINYGKYDKRGATTVAECICSKAIASYPLQPSYRDKKSYGPDYKNPPLLELLLNNGGAAFTFEEFHGKNILHDKLLLDEKGMPLNEDSALSLLKRFKAAGADVLAYL